MKHNKHRFRRNNRSFKICENKESSYLNYYNFMAIMKYFDSNMVNFAEINNIRVNITYVWTTSFSAILWCFRAQTIYCDVVYFSVKSIVTEPCIYQNLNTSGCHGCLCFLQHPILELVINVYNKLTHILI